MTKAQTLELAMLLHSFITDQQKQQKELVEFYQRSVETQNRGLQQLDLLLSFGKND